MFRRLGGYGCGGWCRGDLGTVVGVVWCGGGLGCVSSVRSSLVPLLLLLPRGSGPREAKHSSLPRPLAAAPQRPR